MSNWFCCWNPDDAAAVANITGVSPFVCHCCSFLYTESSPPLLLLLLLLLLFLLPGNCVIFRQINIWLMYKKKLCLELVQFLVYLIMLRVKRCRVYHLKHSRSSVMSLVARLSESLHFVVRMNVCLAQKLQGFSLVVSKISPPMVLRFYDNIIINKMIKGEGRAWRSHIYIDKRTWSGLKPRRLQSASNCNDEQCLDGEFPKLRSRLWSWSAASLEDSVEQIFISPYDKKTIYT